MVHMKRSI